MVPGVALTIPGLAGLPAIFAPACEAWAGVKGDVAVGLPVVAPDVLLTGVVAVLPVGVPVGAVTDDVRLPGVCSAPLPPGDVRGRIKVACKTLPAVIFGAADACPVPVAELADVGEPVPMV